MSTHPFTPVHRQRLIDALLDAFATRDELDLLVWAALEQNPQTLISDRVNLTRAMGEVVDEAASRQGGIRRLVTAASDLRSGHVALVTLSQEWRAIEFETVPQLPKPPVLTIKSGGGLVNMGTIATEGGDFVGRDLYKNYYAAPPNKPFFLNVPSMPSNFVGREELVEQLVQRLCDGQSTALSTDGLPGVGKTTLAIALARHPTVLNHFSDGVLWAGLGRKPDVASIQASWAEALGTQIREIPEPYERISRISNAIATRKLLIVLDDAWQLEAAQQLRCSSPNVVHLLTTRNQEVARQFSGATHQVPVPPLQSKPSYELLQVLAPEAWSSDPAAAQALADKVDGLPLALELLGGYLSASSQRRITQRRQQALYLLQDPAARLQLATKRLGDNSQREVTLHQTIALSLEDLPETTVNCFYSLGAFAPKPARFDLAAAMTVSQADEDEFFELIDRHLLEWNEDETLAFHRCLADLARSHLPANVTERHRDHYLALVDEDREDWQRIEKIYPQVGFAWQQQLKTGGELLFSFVSSLRVYQNRRGLWQDKLQWSEVALNFARSHDLIEPMSYMLVNIGDVYSNLGEMGKALEHLEQALPMARQVEDKRSESTILNNIGLVYSALGEMGKALEYFEQSLPMVRQVGGEGSESTILNNIGLVYATLGEKGKALEYFEQSLPMVHQAGDKGGEAFTLNNIGGVYFALGEQGKALEYWERALPMVRKVGDKRSEATILGNMGAIYSAENKIEIAREYFEQALALQLVLGDRFGEMYSRWGIARLYQQDDKLETAIGEIERALILAKQIQSPHAAELQEMLNQLHSKL